MEKLFLLFLSFLVLSLTYGQYTASDSIADTKHNTYSIRKVSGDNIDYTDLYYKNTLQIINENAEAARNTIKKNYLGGRLRVDVDRNTSQAANSSNFTIIVQDADGMQLLSYKPKNSNPLLIGNQYHNPLVVPISIKIRPPFYVVVREINIRNPCKFLVE